MNRVKIIKAMIICNLSTAFLIQLYCIVYHYTCQMMCDIFTKEYTDVLNVLRSRSKSVYASCDYNIDLLKIGS